MASSNNANIGFEKQIWDAACVLWGHIPAAEYRKVIVGLIFLRYISSAFEKRYQQLVDEGDGFEDDKDAYAEDNIFFVPEDARWSKIASVAHTPEIGTVIDEAMRTIEKENTILKNVLPKNYASPDLDKRVLGDVVDLFTNMDMGDTEESKDLLGRTYEYCIQQFAAYEGVKGGEFYTPASIVKTIVAILKPFKNCRVYDPCCGSGGMFVQSAKFIQAHSGKRGEIAVYGQESNADTWKMAKMNMAIRGIDADFGPYQADTFFNDFLDEQRMCRLYEKFILEYYRKEHPEIRASASQIPWNTDDDYREMLPVMQSDIMLKSVDKTLVIDAKYYAHTTQSQYNTNTLHSGNLYQIFTYVKNLDTSNSGNVAGMLLYAKTDEIVLPNNDYKMGGNQISVKTLDLDCEFAEIKRQLDDIVQRYFDCS